MIALATVPPMRPPTDSWPDATAAISALDTLAATGCTLAQSTSSAIDFIACVAWALRAPVAARTFAQSMPRMASATDSASACSVASSGSAAASALPASYSAFRLREIGGSGRDRAGRDGPCYSCGGAAKSTRSCSPR